MLMSQKELASLETNGYIHIFYNSIRQKYLCLVTPSVEQSWSQTYAFQIESHGVTGGSGETKEGKELIIELLVSCCDPSISRKSVSEMPYDYKQSLIDKLSEFCNYETLLTNP